MEPRRKRRDHQYYEDLIGAVALGAATLEERQAVLAHASECAVCRTELAELRAVVTALPLALDERVPSPILRFRIQSALQHELATGVQPSPESEVEAVLQGAAPLTAPLPAPLPPPVPIRRSPAAILWAAAALLLFVVSAGLVYWNVTLQQEQQRRDEAVDTIAVALEIASPPANAGADLTYLEDRGVFLLSVRSLPELVEDQVFQVWLIGEGDPVSVGTFAAETAEVAVAADRASFNALAVSVEPGPVGSPGPTTPPILVADLSAQLS